MNNQIIAAASAAQPMPVVGINPLTVMPQDGDTASLPTAIQEWRRVRGEIGALQTQIKERNRRAKALEVFIMDIMKRYNIGALDLKSSNSRVLYKRGKRTASLNPKTMQALLTEYMKSEETAADIMKFLTEKREKKETERLAYESFE
jgi:hypothetical protein